MDVLKEKFHHLGHSTYLSIVDDYSGMQRKIVTEVLHQLDSELFPTDEGFSTYYHTPNWETLKIIFEDESSGYLQIKICVESRTKKEYSGHDWVKNATLEMRFPDILLDFEFED